MKEKHRGRSLVAAGSDRERGAAWDRGGLQAGKHHVDDRRWCPSRASGGRRQAAVQRIRIKANCWGKRSEGVAAAAEGPSPKRYRQRRAKVAAA